MLIVSKIMNILVFFVLSRKSVFPSLLHRVCMEPSETSADAVHALFSHFCYVGAFCALVTRGTHSKGCKHGCCDYMPTRIRKDVFLDSLALPRAGQDPCQRRETTVPPIKDVCLTRPAKNRSFRILDHTTGAKEWKSLFPPIMAT